MLFAKLEAVRRCVRAGDARRWASRATLTMTSLEHSLEHVFWLGGPPCAGKTSISEFLASQFDLDLYHVDEAFEAHARHFDSILHPSLTKWCAASWNERWMQPIDSLVRDAIACYQEHFTLILEDVLSAPTHKPLLVEGTALLPGQVARVLSDKSRAMWIIPTTDFQRRHYSRREWVGGILEQCDNPEAAFNNWMAREAEFARWVTAEAAALGLGQLQVSGERTVEENAMAVAAHFQLSDDVRLN
jgi:2-phosphoglycerate kinase